MKKLITFATAASLLMGSMAVPVYAATFADINTVTWDGFKPFLEQAAELKLMSGYDENGKKYCKPRNNVTYCEAVQLMYSIMKVYSGQDVNDATVTKWKPVISAYNIPDWAYKATAYALDNSILTTGELNKLQGNANKINTKAATREDVGVIFGKALDTVKGYDIKSAATLSYADKSKISSAAVPYLELLNRAGLMVGDTDNKFNPKANISRAEMAVLSVKSYNKLTETGTTTPETTKATTTAGTIVTRMVMQNGDLFISMKTNTGTNLSLFGAKGSLTAKYDGEKIDFSDVGEGDTVKVTYTGTNMSALEVVYSKAGIDGVDKEEEKEDKTTEETYELEDINDSKVYVLDGSKEKNFRLDDDVKVTLDGKKSSVSKLADALEDAEYDVTLTLDEDDYVLEIEAVLNDNNPTEGYVDDVDEDE
ncbi:MAG: S-layer homology domain-containing protein, partial [Anaerotignum sp.]|nr:S-layer homology domain-containing protein [Anaerotignum sp.]